MKHPDIECVCAAPVDAGVNGTVPAAMIVTRKPLTQGEVQDFSTRKGATHAVPQVIVFAPNLPLLGVGKVDRVRVRNFLQQAYESARGAP